MAQATKRRLYITLFDGVWVLYCWPDKPVLPAPPTMHLQLGIKVKDQEAPALPHSRLRDDMNALQAATRKPPPHQLQVDRRPRMFWHRFNRKRMSTIASPCQGRVFCTAVHTRTQLEGPLSSRRRTTCARGEVGTQSAPQSPDDRCI